jgi:putative ABC transport system permease protein
MHDLLQDIRFAFRTLIKSPLYTALAVLTIALGIGATTAVFSMVNGVLLRRLPYAGGDQLVRLVQTSATAPDARFSIPELNDYRTQVRALAAVSEYHSMPFQLYGRGEPQRVQTGVVSDNFFTMLGVRALHGRLFLPGEEAVGAAPVVVLSHAYWVNKLGADPNIVGSTFVMNDHVHTIVGILPPLPTYPDANDIWMPAGACPFRSSPRMMSLRAGRMLAAYALVQRGSTVERAQDAVTVVSNRMHLDHPGDYPAQRRLQVDVIPLREELTRASRPLFLTLLGTAIFVLLVATANFANLTLSRQIRRGSEIALRSALGARRVRLYRQLATESLCVTLTGGVLGVLFAVSGLGLLRSFATRVTPRAGEIALDGSVLAFALATSILVGLAAALFPMFRRQPALSSALRSGAAATTGAAGDGRARRALVGLQVSLAFVLLTGAGLMTRSLLKLQAVDGGYETDHVATARVDLDWSRYTADEPVNQFADALMARLGSEPGVQKVALASDFPLNNAQPSSRPFLIRGREAQPGGATPMSDITVVTPDYFETIGITLLRGRRFTAADRDPKNAPALIAQRLASTYWPGGNPIGEQISLDNGTTWSTVVGIVEDVRHNGLSHEITDQIYLPFAATPSRDIRVLVRAAGDPAAMGAHIRTAVRQLDARQPVVEIQTLEQLRGVRLSEPRVTTALMGLFAVLALGITAAGLFGVVAYSVTQRLSEIGIRLALGAEAAGVLRMLMRDGLSTVLSGLAFGLIVAWAGRHVIAGLLYDLSPGDPLTFLAVATLLLGIAAVACYIPARRALSVDPVQTLRSR